MSSDIIKKLQKLKVMAERGIGHEAENAQRIFEALSEKYGIKEEQIGLAALRQKRVIKCPKELKEYLKQIAFSLELGVYSYTNRKGSSISPVIVDCNEEEQKLLEDLIKTVSIIYKYKKKEAMMKVSSYMAGYVSSTYPVNDKAIKCPHCDLPLEYVEQERRYVCSCGYKSRKVKRRLVSQEEYMTGMSDSGRLLK